MTSANQVLDIARSQLGVKESPAGSNRTPYGQAFGLNGVPWCSIFAWYVLNKAGVTMPIKSASVYAVRDAYKRAGRFYSSPQVGDLVFYNYGAGHTGIVESVSSGSITAIEGNTSASNGSQTNGGEVARKVRPRNSLIFGYGRPVYSGTSASPSPVPTDHSSIGMTETYGDDMIRYPVHIAPLTDGRGWFSTGIPFEKVISIVPLGPAPQRDGYDWPNFVVYANDTDGKCELEIEGATPGGSVDIVVWAVN